MLKSAEKAFRKGELEEATILANQAAVNAETENNSNVYSLLGKISLQKFVDSEYTALSDARESLAQFNMALSKADEKTKEDIMTPAYDNPVDQEGDPIGGEELGLLEYYLQKISFGFLQEEEYEKGYPLLQIAYEITPSVERAFFIGYGAQNSDDMETAIDFFTKVTEYDTAYDNKSYAYQVVIQELTETEKYEEALALTMKAKADYPEEKNYNNIEVELLIRADKMDEAIGGLQGIVDAGDATKESYYTLSYLYWNNEELDKAEATAKKALELDSDYVDALYVAASVIYTQAANYMTEANTTIDDDDKYTEFKEKAASRFRDAQPMYVKCLAADPNDLYYLRPLSTTAISWV